MSMSDPLSNAQPPVAGATSPLTATYGLATLLKERRDAIIASFVAQVRRADLSPPGLSLVSLVDHIPSFLDEIAAELAAENGVTRGQDAADSSDIARQHGHQRWSLGYDVEGLIREYGVLRHCIIEAVKASGTQLSLEEFETLAKCLNVGVSEAARAYAHHRDDELQAQKATLEFLVEAGELLSSSLDYRSTLARLTRLLVPRLADWCAVHLDDGTENMPIAHVDPAKAELVRELYRRYPVPKDADWGYPHVVQTGEPQLMTSLPAGFSVGIARDAEHLAMLEKLGSCSWIVVPLKVQSTIFGALTLAFSDSGRHYLHADLGLAVEVARRAAVAIDNARLYELSQKERSRFEAATRAKDEFVATVSHELRTPLNAILGWLRLMKNGALPEEKRAHAFDVIERNANAQNQLVADLLDISRITTGKMRINLTQVDMATIVGMAIDGIRPAAEAKGISIEVDIDASETVLRADGDRLEQVAWNLLSNAVKFTPKNGSVRVELRRVDSELELVVADSGEGIAPTFLPHVFESFRQSDATAARAHAGLGLGLSIAKHIVELHGGHIQARSDGAGRGASFTTRLPVRPVTSTAIAGDRVPATKGPTEPEPLPVNATGVRVRVLVVDDDQDARDLLGFVLESCGMEVRSAGSAVEALTALETYDPDVIVSDIGMPGQDGYSLIRSIRMLPSESKKNVPAVALTAFARNEDRTRALVAGFNVHIAKPVEPATLVATVRDLAGHSARATTPH